MKKLIGIVAAAGFLSVAASAQNYNAFKVLQNTSGISITQTGDTFTLSLSADPTVTIKGKTSPVKDVTGFWLLDSNGNLNATLDNQTGYQLKTNSGGGTSADGWFTQNPNGIQPGQTVTFTAASLNSADLTSFGLMLHANGVPAHVQVPTSGKQPTPEPATIGALLIGAVGLLRRKRTA